MSNLLSRRTGRRLDRQLAGNMRALRSRCRTLFGRDNRLWGDCLGLTNEPGKGQSTPKVCASLRLCSLYDLTLASQASSSNAQVLDAQVVDMTTLPTLTVDPDHFVFSKDFDTVFEQFYVLFRFVPGCQYPRSVDDKMAWTSPSDKETARTRLLRDVWVTYKTQDGQRTVTGYVPLANVGPCMPLVQSGELALVVKGKHAGKIIYPARFAKEGKRKVGVYCKLKKNGKKKEEELFDFSTVTRVMAKDRGPPSN